MIKKLNYLILLLLVFCPLLSILNGVYASESEWELFQKNEGISIYTRAVEGSNIAEVKAVTVLNTRIEVIAVVLRDIPAYPQWMSGCKETQLIERFDENNMILYYVQETPWPLQNRDVVLRATTQINWKAGFFTVNTQSVADSRMLVKKNLVRMPEMKGQWFVEYIDRQHTRATFQSKIDPAGAIPAFLVNANNSKFIHKTLLGLKNMVKKPKYIEVANQSQDKTILEGYIERGYLTR